MRADRAAGCFAAACVVAIIGAGGFGNIVGALVMLAAMTVIVGLVLHLSP